MIRRPPRSTPFPYPALFRSTVNQTGGTITAADNVFVGRDGNGTWNMGGGTVTANSTVIANVAGTTDRKSTRLNSSHANISYAVFCLKKNTYVHLPHIRLTSP